VEGGVAKRVGSIDCGGNTRPTQPKEDELCKGIRGFKKKGWGLGHRGGCLSWWAPPGCTSELGESFFVVGAGTREI